MGCECKPGAKRTNQIEMYLPVCEKCTGLNTAPSRDGRNCVSCDGANLEKSSDGKCLAKENNYALK